MTDYTTILNDRAEQLQVRKMGHHDIDPNLIFDVIDWAENETVTDAYFARLIREKIIPAREVTKRRDAARQRIKIAELLGKNPDSPMSFVAALSEKIGLRVDWKGSLWIADEFKTLVDLKRVMRIRATELKLPFERGDVDDATEQHYLHLQSQRPAILNDILSVRREFDWCKLASCFDQTGLYSEGLVIAILQKTIHSARRKLANKKVAWHLMPVFHGVQGGGKTYLIERMMRPVAEATSWSNFEQITDDRNIALWDSLVIVLDEMARAAKADAETIKHVITAETLDRRPMRSNITIPVQNRATMIGASNHRLDELIKDETGNRRFAELLFRRPSDPNLIDSLDFFAMWASIQPDDADPLANYRDELAALQRQNVVFGPVQDWLEHIDEYELSNTPSATFTTEQLYRAFLLHRERVTPHVDYQARTQNAFASELRRVVEQNEGYGLRKVHTRHGNRWKFDTKPRFEPIEAGMIAFMSDVPPVGGVQ